MSKPPKRRGPVAIELEATPATPRDETAKEAPQQSESAPKPAPKRRKAAAPQKPKPVQIEVEARGFDPSSAPAVPEIDDRAPQGRAMAAVVNVAARKRNGWFGRIFWGGVLGLLGLIVSVAAWDFVANLLARNPVLGQIALVLAGVVCLGLVLICLRELAAMSRLARVDGLRAQSEAAFRDEDADVARDVAGKMSRLYRGRPELEGGRLTLETRFKETLDANALLHQTERNLLEPLDAACLREIEAASRTVATATALIPLALADVLAALTSNLRMVRRIAEIYGGRAGFFGSWRLMRAVATHLVATGAVSIGDDMIGSMAGGGALAKISRRFGEGVINGALTARVGVAAMEVCRPMPFAALERPSVTGLVRRALTGLFSKG